MYAIGIDPSTSCTGLVILKDDSNVPVYAEGIKPSKKCSGFVRVLDMRDGVMGNIAEVINGCPAADVRVAIEGYAYSNANSLADLVEVGTALRLAFLEKRWNFWTPAPSQLKKFAGFKAPKGAKGKAKKPIKEVEQLWGFKTSSGDVADAYVLAQIARGMRGGWKTAKISEAQLEVIMSVQHGLALEPLPEAA